MRRKFLIGLAPVLVIAAFAVVPVAAQAAPHYWVNGEVLEEGTGKTKVSIAWGNITLKGTKGNITGGHVTCHNAAAGTLFNPSGGGAGEGLVTQFAPFSCEQELICPTKTTSVGVKAEKLPWKDLLTEEVAGTIRQETTGIKVNIECRETGVEKPIAELKFVIPSAEKGQRPKGKEGTEALHPGLLEFGAGSGELELEGSLDGVAGITEGAVKTLGYNSQELIALKNP